MMSAQNKVAKIFMIAGLSFVTSLSFADGFGVTGGQDTATAVSDNPAANINQLLGNDQTAPTQPAGTLNSLQIKQILYQKQQQQLPSSAPQQSSQAATPGTPTDDSFGDTSLNQQAFANMIRSMMPLTPDQIITLRKLFDSSQQAAAEYPGVPPRPTSSSVIVNLSPGATPPVIRLGNGFITSLVFLDSTGEPWPVQAYDIGDPNSFNVEWDRIGNTLLVQSNTTYKSGNLAVMLKGQDTPVMLTLLPGQRAVDYRVDLRVPGFGPNASPTGSGLPDLANPQLLDFLNGVPPDGAQAVQINGGPCQAWEFAGNLYLRTQLTVLSPSWLASMSSPDGTNVYEIVKSPVILASYRGKVVQLTVEGL